MLKRLKYGFEESENGKRIKENDDHRGYIALTELLV